MRTEILTAVGGNRLDAFVAATVPELTRSYAQKLIAAGNITVNGETKKANYRLTDGEEVAVVRPDPQNIAVVPENLPLDILYEDDDIIVLNKARGMTVHPAAGVTNGTLVNALLYHVKNLSGINGELRPGIVHRLDKDTSGVMVAAKTDRAHVNLAEQIGSKRAKRIYLAIVRGNIAERAGIIDAAIGRHPKDRQKMAVLSAGGKYAVTEFTVRERFGGYTLVECRLQTGRTHQIRVHMNYIHHPLLNDPKYGSIDRNFSINGQALHSMSLSLFHPVTGAAMNFTAPLPSDMEQVLSQLRGAGGLSPCRSQEAEPLVGFGATPKYNKT